MDFDCKNIVALHQIGSRETEWPLSGRGSYCRAGQSRIGHASRGHIPAKGFLPVQVEDCAVVDHVRHHKRHARWICRKIKMSSEINRGLLRIEETDVSVGRT